MSQKKQADKKQTDKKRASTKQAEKQAKKLAAEQRAVEQKLRRGAEKAVARAEAAVEAARDAVRTSSKQLRKQVSALAKRTEKLAVKHEQSVRELTQQQARAHAALATHAAATGPDARPTPQLTPPLPKPAGAVPTLIELRELAKEQRIVGYSRMNKATLLERVDLANRA
ncbi:hypothetical protein SAMN06295909_0690 [Plantibacter sp. VKM Ac-1784]|uniref:Rho termination factor N-terminal domain-containing protein n=1 Tax=Plantibacter elymi (nom. nud.) TaxID=199708 RepID=A0ABY1R8U1_9MICO|nr:hypothetical protein [Plantibacter sp. VKM Ac-1784]SMQ62116.1 hypothetical protein SAMN06295909_0690 [Plantibacter sp. VKM Ac-1784]